MNFTTRLEKPTFQLCKELENLNKKDRSTVFFMKAEELLEENYELIIAREKNRIVGFLVFKMKRTKTRVSSTDISTFVKRSHRKRGIGKKLVLHHLRLIERRKLNAKTATIKSIIVSAGGECLMRFRKKHARKVTIYQIY